MNEDKILESETWRGNEEVFGFRMICLKQVSKVAVAGSKELTKGYWKKTLNARGEEIVLGYIGDGREDYSQADAYYNANPQLKAYSEASKQLDRDIVNALALTLGLQAAIDLEALYSQYQDIANEAAYAYRDAHPEMGKYSEAKGSKLKEVVLKIAELAKKLPETPLMNIRPDFVPQGTTQTALAKLIQPSPKMTLDDYLKTYKISDATWTAVKRFFDGDKPLPTEVRDQLDYLAQAKGEDGTSLLLDLAVVYYK